MPFKIITIAPDGKIVCETHKKHPGWKEIQGYVDGMFQVCPYFTSMELDGKKYKRGIAYCNEEGKIKGMAFNPIASALWLKSCPKGEPDRMLIAGPLLFVVKEGASAKAS